MRKKKINIQVFPDTHKRFMDDAATEATRLKLNKLNHEQFMRMLLNTWEQAPREAVK